MSRRRLLQPLAFVICLALFAGTSWGQKPSKEEKEAAREQQQRAQREQKAQQKAAQKPAGGKQKDTSNQSVKTQRKTADAFAADRNGKKPETSEGFEPLTGTDKELADLEKQLKDEDARHAAALKGLRKNEQAAAKSRDARKIEAAKLAIDKENETYQKKRASIDERRREVMERANPKPAAEKPAIASPGAEAARSR